MEVNIYDNIDPSKLTTQERRALAARLQKYLTYFQEMQKRAEERKLIDRVVDSIKPEKKNKEKEQERIKKYYDLLSTVYEKTRKDEPAANDSKTVISGVAVKNDSLAELGGGAIAYGGAGMAAGSTTLGGGLLGAGIGVLDTVAGLSDKEQAVFYKKLCETLMGVVSAFNVPEEVVKQELLKTMKNIGEIKEKYKDISDEEEMAKRIQDECVVELTAGVEETRDCDAFKEKVLNVIGQDAWDKMNSNSQIFIVTAELLFEQWKIYEDGIDFGPICLSASKALEVEVTRRYFVGFRDYLQKEGLSLPDEMYNKDGSIKETDDYMLGNLTGVTGYAVYLDTQKVKLIGRFTDINQLFLRYAKDDLMKGKSESQCVDAIKGHLLSVKNVCQNYRNPAAHKKKMNKVSARECLDYMIDVKRILGKLIDDCRW